MCGLKNIDAEWNKELKLETNVSKFNDFHAPFLSNFLFEVFTAVFYRGFSVYFK